MVRLAKRIAWLRGDPESLHVIKNVRDILRIQNIEIIMPEPDEDINVDVAVMPGPDSIERLYEWKGVKARFYVRDVKDPWRALSEALVYPSDTFKILSIGVDPGPKASGLSALADDILLWASKIPNEELADRILWLRSWIPFKLSKVYVGKSFSENVRCVLDSADIKYILVDERGTTVTPSRWYVLEELKNRDIVASVTIALIGIIEEVL